MNSSWGLSVSFYFQVTSHETIDAVLRGTENNMSTVLIHVKVVGIWISGIQSKRLGGGKFEQECLPNVN